MREKDLEGYYCGVYLNEDSFEFCSVLLSQSNGKLRIEEITETQDLDSISKYLLDLELNRLLTNTIVGRNLVIDRNIHRGIRTDKKITDDNKKSFIDSVKGKLLSKELILPSNCKKLISETNRAVSNNNEIINKDLSNFWALSLAVKGYDFDRHRPFTVLKVRERSSPFTRAHRR